MRCPTTQTSRVQKNQRGFTLVEMIVAVALFAIVMVVCIGALLALVGANRKAQALQSVMNNLNVAVDSMVRSIREGADYNCGSISGGNCSAGGTILYITPSPRHNTSSYWVYEFVDNHGSSSPYHCAGPGQKTLCRSTDSGMHWQALTSPEVTLDSVTFYVIGATPGDEGGTPTQPKVLIVLKGTAGTGTADKKTTFHLQATALQRVLDI